MSERIGIKEATRHDKRLSPYGDLTIISPSISSGS